MKLVRNPYHIHPSRAAATPTAAGHSGFNRSGFNRSGFSRRGFTLIETAMVMTLIGLGVLAMLELLAAGSVSNGYGAEMTTAVHLANNIHEISLGLEYYDKEDLSKNTWDTKEGGGITAYDNVTDLDNTSFSPPLDVRRLPMRGYEGWGQRITVETVAEDFLSSTRPDDMTEPTARVTVTIFRNGRDVYTTSWLAVAPAPP